MYNLKVSLSDYLLIHGKLISAVEDDESTGTTAIRPSTTNSGDVMHKNTSHNR